MTGTTPFGSSSYYRDQALVEVAAERNRQDAKFGARRILHQSPTLRLVILMEEVGELARAVLERDAAALRAEAVQVAAVAVAMVEHLDHDHGICHRPPSAAALTGQRTATSDHPNGQGPK